MAIFSGFKRVRDPQQIQLGQVVRDRISGYQGTAASRVEYLTGCTQIAIACEGLDPQGKPHEWHYFDWQRLEVKEGNPFFDVVDSDDTQRRNGPGEPPRGRY